jgi:hypothetical protein
VEREYLPDLTRSRIYDRLYERYRRLGAFIEADIMKEHKTA